MQTTIKTLLLTVATALIANAANAQGRTRIKTDDYREPVITEKKTGMIDQREKWAYGPKAGFNYSGVYNISGDEFSPKGGFGLAAGGFVGIPISKIFGVQPEVLFSQKGFSATGKVGGMLYDIRRTTSYLDVPVLLAVKPSRYYTLLVGPQYSYLLQQKDEYTFPPTGKEPIQAAMDANLRKSMFAVTASIDVSSSHMVLSLRGGMDMSYNTDNVGVPRYKNRWLQLTIGYKF